MANSSLTMSCSVLGWMHACQIVVLLQQKRSRAVKQNSSLSANPASGW